MFLFKVLGSVPQSRLMDYLQLQRKRGGIHKKKWQVSPFSVLLCPSLFPQPILPHKLSVLFTIPLSPPREQCVCSPPPPPPHLSIPSIPPSICLVLSVTSLPCQAMRERGRDKPCHCPRPNPQNINSVFLEQQRRALASNLSDLMMSGPLFFGPFI